MQRNRLMNGAHGSIQEQDKYESAVLLVHRQTHLSMGTIIIVPRIERSVPDTCERHGKSNKVRPSRWDA